MSDKERNGNRAPSSVSRTSTGYSNKLRGYQHSGGEISPGMAGEWRGYSGLFATGVQSCELGKRACDGDAEKNREWSVGPAR